VQAAVCNDILVNHTTNSPEYGAYQIARQALGWKFTDGAFDKNGLPAAC
jgi:hypothetical protein